MTKIKGIYNLYYDHHDNELYQQIIYAHSLGYRHVGFVNSFKSTVCNSTEYRKISARCSDFKKWTNTNSLSNVYNGAIVNIHDYFTNKIDRQVLGKLMDEGDINYVLWDCHLPQKYYVLNAQNYAIIKNRLVDGCVSQRVHYLCGLERLTQGIREMDSISYQLAYEIARIADKYCLTLEYNISSTFVHQHPFMHFLWKLIREKSIAIHVDYYHCFLKKVDFEKYEKQIIFLQRNGFLLKNLIL